MACTERWAKSCPHCGTCTCDRDDAETDLFLQIETFDEGCPLHGEDTGHIGGKGGDGRTLPMFGDGEVT